jgi:hypothetical protein
MMLLTIEPVLVDISPYKQANRVHSFASECGSLLSPGSFISELNIKGGYGCWFLGDVPDFHHFDKSCRNYD